MGRRPRRRDQANSRGSALKIGWLAHRDWKRARIGWHGRAAREIHEPKARKLRACHRYFADASATSGRWLFEPVAHSPSSEPHVSSFVLATANQIGLFEFPTR